MIKISSGRSHKKYFILVKSNGKMNGKLASINRETQVTKNVANRRTVVLALQLALDANHNKMMKYSVWSVF